MDWKIILLTALSAFIGSIGQLEYKRGASDLQFDVKLLLTNYHLIIGTPVGTTNWIGVFFILLGITLIATRPGG